jgi:hypothetical protein
MAEGASLDQKQRLQQLFLPEGVAFPTPGLLPSSRQAFIDAPSSRHAARLSMTVTTRAVLAGDATCCRLPPSGASTSPTRCGGESNP